MTQQIYKLEDEGQFPDVLKSIAKKYGDYIKKERSLNLRKKADKEIYAKEAKKFKGKLNKNNFLYYRFECSDHEVFERIEQIPQKGITVDLLYLEGCDDQKEIVTFEIKAGGNLDTKNCKSNADEVLSLLNSIYIQKKNRERKSGWICGEGW